MHASLTLQSNATASSASGVKAGPAAGTAPVPRKSRTVWFVLGGLLLLGGGSAAAYFRSKGETKPVAVTTEEALQG
ncbi:MAG: hypothetical protein RLZZ221_1518 [Verrucomicrobiota bacterium]